MNNSWEILTPMIVEAGSGLSTGLAVILMFRLLNSQRGSGGQDSALGHQVGEIRQEPQHDQHTYINSGLLA
jgi:hypothetical protein